MYWRPGNQSGAHARKRGQTKAERKHHAINEAARYVRYVYFADGYDTRRISMVDVHDILSDIEPGDGARFAGAVLAPETRAALGRLGWFTLWRIAYRARHGERP